MAAEPELLDELVGEVTVGETYFFREPQQLAVIRDEVLPTLLASRPPKQPVLCWSAGCATGEEPYTLALLLAELGSLSTAQVLGTDLSRAALAWAHRARYRRWSFRGVPPDMLASRFQPAGDHYTVAPEIRQAVRFGYLNLAEDTWPSFASGVWAMDLILCRNVLIYLDRDTIVRIAGRLIDSLSSDGWLFLGSSDPVLSDLVRCDVEMTAAGLAYRRPGANPRRTIGTALGIAAVAEPPQEFPCVAPPLAGLVTETRVSDQDSIAATRYAGADYDQAARAAVDLTFQDGARPEPWIALVRSLSNQGRLEEAGRASAAGVDRHPDSAELHYLQALLLGQAGYHEPAATAARRALYLDRTMVVAHVAHGMALNRLDDARGARRALNNAAQLLAAMPAEAIVPASDGESAGRLGEMIRAQLRLLDGQGTWACAAG